MKKLVSMVLVLLLIGTCAMAERTLTVQGTGIVSVPADRVNVNLGVREVAPDVLTAQNTVNARIDAVIEALNGMGDTVLSISTNGLGIYPNYSYDEVESISGYTAYNTLCVTLGDADAAGACIDAAFAAGANSLDYVEFTAQDTAEAAEQALELAVQAARKKAEVLAGAAGVTLGAALQITDGSNSGFYDSGAGAVRTEEADASTKLIASSQQVMATVTITYAID